MDRYQRVEKPREEAPIKENEIRITTQGRMRNYITYATALLQVPTHTRSCHGAWRGVSMPLRCLNSRLSAIMFRTSSRRWWPGQKITGRLGKGIKIKRKMIGPYWLVTHAIKLGFFKCSLEMPKGYTGLWSQQCFAW
jgi:hypothetical protein